MKRTPKKKTRKPLSGDIFGIGLPRATSGNFRVYGDDPIGVNRDRWFARKRDAETAARKRSLLRPGVVYVMHAPTGYWSKYIGGTRRVIASGTRRTRRNQPVRVVLVSYHADGSTPYTGMLHDEADNSLGQAARGSPLRRAIAASGAADGDEIEVRVVRTGRRPFGDRKVRLVAPHKYEREESGR